MNVTTEMVDKELRYSFYPAKAIAFLLSRKWGINTMNFLTNLINGKKIEGLFNEERYISGKNGGQNIRVRIFKPLNFNGKLPALIYYHGGGYVVGNPESYLGVIQKFIETRPCVVITPDYRKALQAPFPAAFDDCYDTLLWVKKNADAIGVYDTGFIIAGHSAGGGLTAAVTLKARDTHDVNIAFQMPVYPMLDHRQITESAKDNDAPTWNSKTNAMGWKLYLKDLVEQNKEIPAYASPALNKDYTHFPPTITFVGDLEPFKDETIAYVEALKSKDIPVEFKLYKGCFHGFDIVSSTAGISKEAVDFTYQSFANYYDRYCKN